MAKMLVLEDEPVVRDVIARRLGREGHTILSHPDAAPALDTVNFDEIDLIITDLVMPTPGDEAIQTIRSRGIAVPIIVLTANLQKGDEERLMALGADCILTKPFHLMSLLTNVDLLLAGG